jgi:hypothetical protein
MRDKGLGQPECPPPSSRAVFVAVRQNAKERGGDGNQFYSPPNYLKYWVHRAQIFYQNPTVKRPKRANSRISTFLRKPFEDMLTRIE